MESICRVCRSTTVTLVEIYAKRKQPKDEPSLAEMLNECVDCEVKPDDPLPKQICLSCVLETQNAFRFKRKCERSHQHFWQLLTLKEEENMNATMDQMIKSDDSYIGEDAIDMYNLLPNCEAILMEDESDCLRIRQSGRIRKKSYKAEHNSSGSSEALSGSSQARRGSSQARRGSSQARRESSQALTGSSEALAGSREALEGSTEALSEDVQTNLLPNCEAIEMKEILTDCHSIQQNKRKKDKKCKEEKVNKEVSSESLSVEYAIDMENSQLPHCEAIEMFENVQNSYNSQQSKPKKNKKTKAAEIPVPNESHLCEVCGQEFLELTLYIEHSIVHKYEDRKFKCEKCPKAFNKPSRLKSHSRVHCDKRPYKCTMCSRDFTHGHTLKNHMLTHTGELPFKCPECPKAFNRNSNLQTHLYVHSGIQPFLCPHCSKTFNNRSNLRKHIRIHTGERAHKCPYCDKLFSRMQHLNDHIGIHTGECPYKCDKCKRDFRSRVGLRGHKCSFTEEKTKKTENSKAKETKNT